MGTCSAVDARGQTLTETLGALTATRTYAPSTGQMLSFAYTAGNTLRRTQSYRYDLFANLSRRVLDSGVTGITATTETFANDVLDRLTQSQRSGGATGTVTYAYAPNGNLRTKSDYSLGNGYAYGAVGKNAGGNAGPHAVRQVQRSAEGGNGTVNFSYDNNGNLTAVTDPTLPFGALYDHRNLPTYIQRGAATSRLFYGADDQRARQTGSDGTHIYLPGFEDVIAAGGTAPVESRAYLGDYAVISRSANPDTLEYLLTDRLGSVDAVASTAGMITEKRAYDAFGAPRNGTTWANLSPKRLPSLAVTQKGYTAHEHLDSVELIHMNGRAYDYKVGRFLSVDPLIQFPNDSQSLNPYSYVLNNPMGWTDPTGYRATGAGSCEERAGCDVVFDINAALFKQRGPAMPRHGGGNGAESKQSSEGTGGRKEQDAPPSDKGSAKTLPTIVVRPSESDWDEYRKHYPQYRREYREDFIRWQLRNAPMDVFGGFMDLAYGWRGTVESVRSTYSSLREGDYTPAAAHAGATLVSVISGKIKPVSTVVRTGVQAFEVGKADDLLRRSMRGDGLDVHHVGQAHPLQQVVPEYNRVTAPAIALPRGEHAAIPTLRGSYAGNARDQLAKDVRDLRNYTNAPNSSLQQLIEINKQMYPGAYKK